MLCYRQAEFDRKTASGGGNACPQTEKAVKRRHDRPRTDFLNLRTPSVHGNVKGAKRKSGEEERQRKHISCWRKPDQDERDNRRDGERL